MDDKDFIIAQLTAQVHALLQKVNELEEKVSRLKKDSNNSSKPPSSDIVKPKRTARKKVKRKRGGQKGHKKNVRQTFTSEQVNNTIEYEFVAADAVGLIPLNEWHRVQQVSLPEKLYYVTEHKARKYMDPQTGKIHIVPLPDEVRQGGLLCKTVLKVSDALQWPYEHLKTKLPQGNILGIDETGHKDNKKLRWSWCFQTPHYSLFHIDSRKCDVLIEILGKNFKGIIGCDYYGAYRKYNRLYNALMQYCLAHLIRDIRFLAEHSNKTLVRWGKKLLEWLKKMFDTLHKRHRDSQKGYEQKMKKIKQGFLKQVRRPVDHKLAKKLARRFKAKAANHYFRFLTDPNVEPTNNGTEREIRHLVIDRRITQGTRGEAGMRWCERIWTTLATCRKQIRSAFDFIHNAITNYWKGLPCPELA